MSSRTADVFFYGLFMDQELLRGKGLSPQRAGLASVDERDTTCCYARQDKFWVTGAPNGERWEIYTVLQDSATFWGEGGQQSWDAARTQLDSSQDNQGTQCCGGLQAASACGRTR